MFEFLFCPQHGMFRPENILFLATYGQVAWVDIQCLTVRIWGTVKRWR